MVPFYAAFDGYPIVAYWESNFRRLLRFCRTAPGAYERKKNRLPDGTAGQKKRANLRSQGIAAMTYLVSICQSQLSCLRKRKSNLSSTRFLSSSADPSRDVNRVLDSLVFWTEQGLSAGPESRRQDS